MKRFSLSFILSCVILCGIPRLTFCSDLKTSIETNIKNAKLIALHPTLSLCAIAASNSLVLWDLETKCLKNEYFPCGGAIKTLEFTPEGDELVLSTDAYGVQVLDKYGSSYNGKKWDNNNITTAFAFDPYKDQIITGSPDGKLRLWSRDNIGALIALWQGHKGGVTAIAFNQKEKERVVTGGNDGTIKLWNLANFTELKCKDVTAGSVEKIVYLPSHNAYVVLSLLCSMKLYDHYLEHKATLMTDNSLSCALFGNGLAATSLDNKGIRIWGQESLDKEDQSPRFLSNSEKYISTLGSDKEGKNLLSCDREGKLCVWRDKNHSSHNEIDTIKQKELLIYYYKSGDFKKDQQNNNASEMVKKIEKKFRKSNL